MTIPAPLERRSQGIHLVRHETKAGQFASFLTCFTIASFCDKADYALTLLV